MAETSVIGSTTVVRGNIRADGDLEILGRVDGDVITGGDVTIGEDAQVNGRVSGAAISVAGVVVGDITASASIVVAVTAQVQGDLITPRVGIAEGARVRGSLNTEGSGRSETGHRAVSRPRELPRRAMPGAVKVSAASVPSKQVARSASPATPVAGKRKPPPPVVPALRKGARARKKSRA